MKIATSPKQLKRKHVFNLITQRNPANSRHYARSTVAQAQHKVAVIGAGVIGLTTALQLAQTYPNSKITVIAENISDGTQPFPTTSSGAGGLWKPYTLGSTPPESINRWGAATLNHYLDLYFSTDAQKAGVFLTSAYQLWKEHIPDPDWATVVPNFRHLSAKELALYDRPGVHQHGWFYTTVITEGRGYVNWLMNQLQQLQNHHHIHIEKRKITSFDELAALGYDAVVNCAGLGAKELCNDDEIEANRGQVLRVKAPWIRHYTNANGECYIIPNSDTVVLGGTLGPGDYDTQPREEDSRKILEKCIAVVPSLATAEVVGSWVGLRPSRTSVRLESEVRSVKGRSDGVLIVHNYGHGGAGLTLAWGCAEEAVGLLISNL